MALTIVFCNFIICVILLGLGKNPSEIISPAEVRDRHTVIDFYTKPALKKYPGPARATL